MLVYLREILKMLCFYGRAFFIGIKINLLYSQLVQADM